MRRMTFQNRMNEAKPYVILLHKAFFNIKNYFQDLIFKKKKDVKMIGNAQ